MTIEHIAIRPGDADYDEARTTFVGSARPAVVLRPTTPAEVAESLRHARAERLPLAIRSGGHSALGFGNVDAGVVLDLSRLDAVQLLGEGRVRIGAGSTWGRAAARLAEHGLAISSGDTVSVGVGGLVQAGGIGWMVRKHGLTIDSVLAAEVVTAAGEVVRASATENPDLLWALRGGAGNFGVVTSFELQACPVATVRFGTLRFELGDVGRLLRGWAAAMASAPDELTTALTLMPALGPMPAGAMVTACLVGEDTDALAALRTIGTVLDEEIEERPYAAILAEAHGPEGVLPVAGNALVDAVDEPLIEAIVAAYAEGRRVVSLRSLGGAFGRVDPAATAFAHRDAQALVLSAAFLPLDASEDQVAQARATWATISAHGVGSYAGFLTSAGTQDVAAVWPAPTLERLRAIKRTWDPENAFRRNLNIVP